MHSWESDSSSQLLAVFVFVDTFYPNVVWLVIITWLSSQELTGVLPDCNWELAPGANFRSILSRRAGILRQESLHCREFLILIKIVIFFETFKKASNRS